MSGVSANTDRRTYHIVAIISGSSETLRRDADLVHLSIGSRSNVALDTLEWKSATVIDNLDDGRFN
jgi:hypothetical protein